MRVEIVGSKRRERFMRLQHRVETIDRLTRLVARQRKTRELNIEALHKTIAEADELRRELYGNLNKEAS